MTRYLSALLLLLTPAISFSSDWLQWRGPERNCHVPKGEAWPDTIDESRVTKKWRVPLGPSYSGPIVAGDRIFVTETRDESHEVVRALDRRTGQELWKVEWEGAIKVPFFAASNGSWIRSTPACDGSHLYVAGIKDVIVCLNVENGDIVWKLDLAKQFGTDLPGFGTVCSPLLDGDSLYIQGAASVVRINKADGEVIWRAAPEDGGLFGSSMGASPFSSPVIAEVAGLRQLVVQTRKHLQGMDMETGKLLWNVEVPAFRGMNILTPHVMGDSIFTSTYGGGSFRFDVTRSDDGFAVAEGWKTKAQGYMSSPVTIGDSIYLHLRNQRFTCIDPETGEARWTTRPFGKYWSMVVNGDRMLVLDQDGSLHLLKANDEEFTQTASMDVSESETWAHLAVANGEIYVRELDAMTVWTWK